jgi:chromosome partitioning protein
MLVYSLVNQKGGCGKTTTAVNLAGAFAARGKRVLLVDLDPQAHATLGLGLAPDAPALAEVLNDGLAAKYAVQSVAGGIDLLPATTRLAEFEERSEHTIRPERVLAEALEPLADEYDYAFIDCPPRADGVLCANALFASNQALLIVETGAFALQGALQALRVFAEVGENQGWRPPVRVIGTMFDRRTRFARDSVIRTSVRLREAPAMGVPVQVLDPTCRACTDFDALTDEILADVPAVPPSRSKAPTGYHAPSDADLVATLLQGED